MVNVTVEIDEDLYTVLLGAANDSGMSVNDFANKLLENYLEDNYGAV
jgi:predicted HicB family RNase H-like nuclease